MSSRREAALVAAVAVLGNQGTRRLTHRAVDAEGGLPPGTTSNYFRTRTALIDGVLAHLTKHEQAMFDQLLPKLAEPDGPEALVTICAAMVNFLLTTGRTLALARYAITLEVIHRPELQPTLVARTQAWWDLGAALLTKAGSPDPHRRARTLLSSIDGLLLDQLARPQPDFDAAAALTPIVRAVLDIAGFDDRASNAADRARGSVSGTPAVAAACCR